VGRKSWWAQEAAVAACWDKATLILGEIGFVERFGLVFGELGFSWLSFSWSVFAFAGLVSITVRRGGERVGGSGLGARLIGVGVGGFWGSVIAMGGVLFLKLFLVVREGCLFST